MHDWSGFFDTLLDVLRTDDEACMGLLRTVGGSSRGSVALMEGDLTIEEALAYARTLLEIGREFEGVDVLRAVYESATGRPEVPMGGQGVWVDVPQGSQ